MGFPDHKKSWRVRSALLSGHFTFFDMNHTYGDCPNHRNGPRLEFRWESESPLLQRLPQMNLQESS